MVPRVRGKLDALHIQQINGKGKKGAGENDGQEKFQPGFILEIPPELLATDEGEKYEIDNVYAETNFGRRIREQGRFLHAKNRQRITCQSDEGQRHPIILTVDISDRIPSGRGFPLDHQGDDPGEDQKDSQKLCEMKLALEENYRKNRHRENVGIPYGSGEARIRRSFDCFKVGPVTDGRGNARECSRSQEAEEFF